MFELSAEHEAFRRVVRDFAEAEIAPYVAQWEREHHLPTKVVLQMGELGLFGLTAPEQYGGSDGRLHLTVRRHRRDRPGGSVDRGNARGGDRARDQPDPDVRHG